MPKKFFYFYSTLNTPNVGENYDEAGPSRIGSSSPGKTNISYKWYYSGKV